MPKKNPKGFLEANRLAARRRVNRFLDELRQGGLKRGLKRPEGTTRPVRPWEVGHASAIGVFLRKRTKPVKAGDIKRHFSSLK
jgi:hypothetical protein